MTRFIYVAVSISVALLSYGCGCGADEDPPGPAETAPKTVICTCDVVPDSRSGVAPFTVAPMEMCVPAILTEDPAVTCSQRFAAAISQITDQIGINAVGDTKVCSLGDGALQSINCRALPYVAQECQGSSVCENGNLTRRTTGCPALCQPTVCEIGVNLNLDGLMSGDPSGIQCNVGLGCADANTVTPLCRPEVTGMSSSGLMVVGAQTGPIDRSATVLQLSVTADIGPVTATGSGSTNADGRVALFGRPCPGATCDVGLEFTAFDPDIELDFPFPVPNQTATNLWISGGTAGARAVVDAAGNGAFPVNTLAVHARGSHDGTTFEAKSLNPNPVPFHVDWATRRFTIPSTSFSASDASGTFTLAASFGPSLAEAASKVSPLSADQVDDFDLDRVPNGQDPCPYFVLWAQDSLTVRDRAQVPTVGSQVVLSGAGPTDLFHNTIVQQVLAGGSVTVRDGAQVQRIITSGTIFQEPAATVAEAFDKEFGFVLPVPPVLPPIAVAGPTLTLFSNTNLAPGTYTSITVSPNVTVTLAGGTYQMGALTLHPNSRLRVAATTFLRVRDQLTLTGQVEPINPAQPRVRIDYAGNSAVHIVKSFIGTVRAPNAQLILGQNATTYRGTFLAREIEVLSDANVTCDVFGDPQAPQMGPPIPRPTPTAGGLSAAIAVTTDWGAGYCVALNVTNGGSVPTTGWAATVDLNGAAIASIWNLSNSASSGVVQITPAGDPSTNAWSRVIQPGHTTHSLGFCANRTDPANRTVAQIVDVTGTF